MPDQEFSLIVSIPDQDPAQHKLEGDSVSVGRGPDSGIQILVAEVSVQHGTFEATENSWKIVDKGSTNGTKVNGAPVGDGVELKPMDRIVFGDTIPAYFVPSAVLAATPVEEVIASIDKEKMDSPAPVAKPAPGSPAAPAKPAPAAPAAAAASTGASTVKLGQVKPGAPVPGPAQPTPAKPAPVAPGGGAPAAPKLPPKPGGAPAPAAPKPAGGAPPAPAAPGGPKPVAPIPLKKPGGAPAAPNIPLPKTPPKPEE